ncbi:Protein CBG21260 [Caenorhabditis briggsae]|uniref:Protein CBG21260 n=2 Tax=Caenorhabditis briggsae TaxID=6238 RepID=A8XZQ0_CAEBR|nr:Protein CBG21260 [Caenorhabditis briggsae]ULT97310.1 hypothetical protein L3Y34_005254 [Caenorhabditis briggsae]CAP38117.1 Protein CBG21260 [Caenorhabditis briggsae]
MTGTERKCFQKYYPSDFDPAKIPRGTKSGGPKIVQRVMTPFNMQCNSCSENIYKGRKFNMDREKVEGEDYLGLKLFRFHMKCPKWLSQISFRTDLENCDYKCEQGAKRLNSDGEEGVGIRNFGDVKDSEDVLDPITLLERRTKQSRREMKAQEELEGILEANSGKEGVDAIGILKAEEVLKNKIDEEEEERMVKELFRKSIPEAKKIQKTPEKPPIDMKRKNEQKERFAGFKLVKKTSSLSYPPATFSSAYLSDDSD